MYLKKDAVPSLFLPQENTRERSEGNNNIFTNILDKILKHKYAAGIEYQEHDYCKPFIGATRPPLYIDDDEMSIQPHVKLNVAVREFEGFADNGFGVIDTGIADHVLRHSVSGSPNVKGDDVDEETPTPGHSGSSAGVGELTDDQIIEQIRTLQKLLLKRRSSRVTNRNLFKDLNSDDHQSPPGVSPVDMDTSFCSTASLVRAVCPGSSKKRKGSSSPSSSLRRIKVTAQIHPPRGGRDSPSVRRVVAPSAADKTNAGVVSREDPNRIELSSPRGRDRARSVPQEGGLPLISRPQRRRTPPEVLLEAHIDQPPVSRKNRIPPIVLREKSGWCGISAEIRRKGLNFLKAQNIAEGIRVFPTAESDFRGIVKFFTNEKIPFHTYQLPSEKGLNVVLLSFSQMKKSPSTLTNCLPRRA
ncbi:hypothetical protein QE152_g22298 [Popillia japonica]|uniref:Uncharacterized protein n=1 Tax=Popillia japonica TaxID=7064 RepID=A0AAW1KLG8_POPJA